MSFGKGRALVKKAIEAYGKPDQWSVDNLKELGNLTASLLPSEIRQIGSQVLKTSLKHIKNGDYGVDQVSHAYKNSRICKSNNRQFVI